MLTTSVTDTTITSPPPFTSKQHTPSSYRVRFRNVAGLRTIRWLIAAGILCLVNFLWWAFSATHAGYLPLFLLLTISLSFKALRMVHEWVHYANVSVPVPPDYSPAVRSVDILTTFCPGEPREMIIQTLEAMQAIRYPHTSYLCDEGDDPLLRAECQRLGVVHVTRQVKVDAKAGNINNALRQATGEMCVVLDPDHVPTPDFLDQVMPYFEDERVGFVQVVQAYGNQAESFVARGAAEQTYHFYGPMMMSMNAYGTVQAIGANCTFRRRALDSIGGHAPGLTEDMHTAMRLHAAGWQSVYVPKIVSRGLVPSSLAAFYSQQLKWSRGAFDLLFRVYPKLFGKFNWAQRIHYLLLPLYFFTGVIALIDLSLPLLIMGMAKFAWMAGFKDLLTHAVPLVFTSLCIRLYAQRWLRDPSESGLHLLGGLLRMGTWWIYTLGFVYAVLGVRVPYIPTEKEGRRNNEWLLLIPNLLLAGLLALLCVYSLVPEHDPNITRITWLAKLNILILLIFALMGLHHVLDSFARRIRAWGHWDKAEQLRWYWSAELTRLRLASTLRRFSPVLVLAMLLATGTVYYRHNSWLSRVPPEWMLTSTQILRIGQTLASGASHTVADSPWARHSPYVITALELPGFTTSQPLPPVVTKLVRAQQIPMLSWSFDARSSMQPAYWQKFAQQLNHLPGPVLLRPMLAAPTATAYRQAWRNMYSTLKSLGVINVVWVWTPETSDLQLQKFPGTIYTNWMASPLQASASLPSYPDLRARLTRTLALHHVPVVVLAPPPTDGNPLRAAQTLANEFPELTTVVFTNTAPEKYPFRPSPVTPPGSRQLATR